MLTFLYSTAYAQIKSFEESGCLAEGDIPTLKCLEVVFQNILVLASGLVILILFIMFVVGSFKYLTSRGDEERLQDAKHTFTYAIIGLVLFLSAYLILTVIDVLFLGGEGTLFKFEIPEFGVTPTP
ncbi:MAG: pilin [Candidatus Paceibacterota bacterium]